MPWASSSPLLTASKSHEERVDDCVSRCLPRVSLRREKAAVGTIRCNLYRDRTRALGAVAAVCRFRMIAIDSSINAAAGESNAQERPGGRLLLGRFREIGLAANVETPLVHGRTVP